MITFPLYKMFGGVVLGALTLGWFSTHAAAFFTLGLMLAQRGSLPSLGKRSAAVLLMLGVLLQGMRFVGVDVYAVRWAQFLQPVKVLVLLIAVWSLVPSSLGILNHFAHLSFPIYVIHWFLIVGYQKLLNNGFLSGVFDSRYSACGFLIVSLAVFMLSALVAQFTKIVAPRFSSTVFGGRI